MYVKDLRKVYWLGGGKTKVAVDKVSFGIRDGEVFTLLGVNGMFFIIINFNFRCW